MIQLSYPKNVVFSSKYSYISGVRCSQCNATYPYHETLTYCTNPECQETLLACYDFRHTISKDILRNLPVTMWRYREFLPVVNPKNIVSLGEGGTPLFKAQKLSKLIGIPELYWKDESGNPTGSFKARGM